jgi:hypothetical protein
MFNFREELNKLKQEDSENKKASDFEIKEEAEKVLKKIIIKLELMPKSRLKRVKTLRFITFEEDIFVKLLVIDKIVCISNIKNTLQVFNYIRKQFEENGNVQKYTDTCFDLDI